MLRSCRFCAVVLLLLSVSTAFDTFGQTSSKKKPEQQVVLWRDVDVEHQDLYFGPGGPNNLPDLSTITFIKQQKGGYSTKYKIKDGSGRIWIAKIGLEAQSEVAAIRLLSAIGYLTEVNYLIPNLTIPGKGTFTNVRLEARPSDVKRGKHWGWGNTPFEGTPQMNGLMLMMAFINNWDLKTDNNLIQKKENEQQYVVGGDLGVSFGKTGDNYLPLLWSIGRSRNNPADYANSKFIIGTNKNSVKINYNGKNSGLMTHFTPADARWLADRLKRLSRQQIRDAFRAANYSESDIDLLARSVEDRISQLDQAGGGSESAPNK